MSTVMKRKCKIEEEAKMKAKKPPFLVYRWLKNPEAKLVQQNSGKTSHEGNTHFRLIILKYPLCRNANSM